jgi:NIMA (never in mitosis gene a)-related kinase
VLRGEAYNTKTDIWALGCILYELCCLTKAFGQNTEEALKMSILSFNIPQISGNEKRESMKDLSVIYSMCMRRN